MGKLLLRLLQESGVDEWCNAVEQKLKSGKLQQR